MAAPDRMFYRLDDPRPPPPSPEETAPEPEPDPAPQKEWKPVEAVLLRRELDHERLCAQLAQHEAAMDGMHHVPRSFFLRIVRMLRMEEKSMQRLLAKEDPMGRGDAPSDTRINRELMIGMMQDLLLQGLALEWRSRDPRNERRCMHRNMQKARRTQESRRRVRLMPPIPTIE